MNSRNEMEALQIVARNGVRRVAEILDERDQLQHEVQVLCGRLALTATCPQCARFESQLATMQRELDEAQARKAVSS